MVDKEMIALVGVAVRTNNSDKNNNYYVNFTPDKKLVDGILQELDENDKELIKTGHGSINIDYTTNIKSDMKDKIKEFKRKLKEKRFVCTLYMYKEDIEPSQNESGEDSKRVYLSRLFEYEENDDIFHGFVEVIKKNRLKQANLKKSLLKDDEMIIDVKTTEYDNELKEYEQYFLECYHVDDEISGFVGPIGYLNGELKKSAKYPAENLHEIKSETVSLKENKIWHHYIYYTGNDFDFDFIDGPPIDIVYQNNEPSVGGGQTVDFIKEKREELVRDINDYRNYGNNMICNMLICITQGFLTVFSGEPGTGKTSICDKIAQLLGASRKTPKDNRYLSISVERGWTSKNDLIGYLNPLKNDEVVDVTGLHEALVTVDKESKAGEEAAPYLVLLDEANLSQMEYYWSSFIKLADDDARRNTPLHFSREHEYMIPDWFKFVATVNNDQTTESFSPRLLDRVWVITLPALDELGNDNRQDNECERISWDTLRQMFEGISEEDDLCKKAKERIEKIYSIYKDGDKPVSPRSKKAIEAYLKAALSCFEGTDDEKINSAIDYVLLQRLLPMINGYISQEFKNALKTEISQYLPQTENSQYPLSAEKFEKMSEQQNHTDSAYMNFFM